MSEIKITLTGQIKGGKNNVLVSRAGLRYPKKQFVNWRNHAVIEAKQQFKGRQTIKQPMSVTIFYYAGDMRRRDVPALIDGIWHVLEKSGVVEDDTFLGGFGAIINFNHMGLDRNNPRAEIKIF